MKGLVARYGTPRWTTQLVRIQSWPEERLLQHGEPFLLHHDPKIDRVPLVRLFGPGRYWRIDGPLTIVGEGCDGDTPTEMIVILEGRRRGEVYGRWFSQYCPEGEIGARLYGELEAISESVYVDMLLSFRRSRG